MTQYEQESPSFSEISVSVENSGLKCMFSNREDAPYVLAISLNPSILLDVKQPTWTTTIKLKGYEDSPVTIAISSTYLRTLLRQQRNLSITCPQTLMPGSSSALEIKDPNILGIDLNP